MTGGGDLVSDPLPRLNWATAEADAEEVAYLAKELALPLPVAQVLVSRGYRTPKEADTFLNPRLSDLTDPFLLPGIEAAVKRILHALDHDEPMAVYGDYDADGVTGAALLVLVLGAMGGCVRAFLPDRMRDGYGFNEAPLERCMTRIEPRLVITVDCGTNAHEAVVAAGRAGVDVIVTDHHEPTGSPAPALAVINPKLCDVPEVRSLAGVGVAFKLCHALVKAGLDEGRTQIGRLDLREFLDLVAVGTVADVAPLTDENRILVRHGLARLNAQTRLGLRALQEVAGVPRQINSHHIGFMLGPRLNAAGRIDDAELALELLLTDDPRRARDLASRLDSLNRERKRIEDGILASAMEQIGDRPRLVSGGIAVGQAGWHTGTIGIVASRISGIYRSPSAVVGFGEDGMGRGSCRSTAQVDVLSVLSECADHLLSYGGHAAAAGFTLEAPRFDAFRECFDTVCRTRQEGLDLRPHQAVDAWIQFGELDDALLLGIDRLRPFGQGNPAPVWGLRAARAVAPPREVGKGLEHLKMTLGGGGSEIEAIAFNMADVKFPEGEIDVIAQLQENHYLGRRKLQLNVKDMAPAAKS